MVEIVYGLVALVVLIVLLSSLMLKRTHEDHEAMAEPPQVSSVLSFFKGRFSAIGYSQEK